jgi:hypothetical protein
MNIVESIINGIGICRRRLKAGASPRDTSKFTHLRQCFADDNPMDQDDPLDYQISNKR